MKGFIIFTAIVTVLFMLASGSYITIMNRRKARRERRF